MKAKGVKKSAFKQLKFHNFDKYAHDITNKLIEKEKNMSFRSYNHKIYTVTSKKIANSNPNENDKECQDPDGITTYLHGSSFAFIIYFNDKEIPDSVEEFKKIYK